LTFRSLLVPALALACAGTDDRKPPAAEAAGPAFPDVAPDLEAGSGDSVFVALATADAVAAVDVDQNRWSGSAPVGRNPVEIDGPIALAADASRGLLYVLLNPPEALNAPEGSHVHVTSRAGYVQKLSLVDLHVLAEARIDADPVAMALSADGSRLVVTHSNANVSVVDTGKMAFSGGAEPLRIPACFSPLGVALSRPDGKTAYVACEGEDALALVDTTDASVPAHRLPIDGALGPRSIAMDPLGERVAVTSGLSMDLRIVDTAAGVSGSPWPVAGAYGSTWSDQSIAVATRDPDGVAVLDGLTGGVVAARAFAAQECEAPRDTALKRGALYVLCSGTASNAALLKLDASVPDLPILARADMADRAEGFVVIAR
jgi:DNA-binding beta-propeller fold protein YncE